MAQALGRLDERSPLLGSQEQTSSIGPSSIEAGKQSVQAKPAFYALSATAMIIIYYAACSSTMLIINKVAIYNLPAPSFVLLCQLLASVFAVKVGHHAGWLEADELEWTKVSKFMWVVVGFLGTIFANIKVLQNSNVETFITFRSSTPLVLSLCDWWWLGRTLPSAQSWFSLVVLLIGSAGYVLVDDGFKVHAYVWLLLWYAFFTFDSVYVKHMCDTVKMTNWGRVYYTNVMAVPAMLLALPLLKEHDVLAKVTWDSDILVPLILSCMVGVCMSHASYLLREAVSATLFTIVGILCKVITVIINCLIWDQHGSVWAIGCLGVCVVAGTFYQQAPKRSDIKSHQLG